MELQNTKKKNKDEKHELMVEGRNPVTEALKTNENIDKLYIQEGIKDGPLVTIVGMAKKKGIMVEFKVTVLKELHF